MRGRAVGVGAEPRGPSGRPVGHVVQRLSWLLHLPGAGFKMHHARAGTLCRLAEGRRKGWVLLSPCSSVRFPVTLVARRSWARPEHSWSEERHVCPRGWVLPRGWSLVLLLWGQGASCSSVPPELHVPCGLGIFFGGEREHRDTRLPRGNAAGSLRSPERSLGDHRRPRKLCYLQLCALTGIL